MDSGCAGTVTSAMTGQCCSTLCMMELPWNVCASPFSVTFQNDLQKARSPLVMVAWKAAARALLLNCRPVPLPTTFKAPITLLSVSPAAGSAPLATISSLKNSTRLPL